MNTALEPIDLEQQAYHVRVSALVLVCALLQSGLLALFALSGTVDGWIATAFLALSAGSSLLFFALYKLGLNLQWQRRQLAVPQFLSAAVIQLVFIVLAPKLAILFMLVLLTVFAYGLAQLSTRQFWAGWLAFGLSSGIALWLARDQLGIASDVEIGLLWFFFVFALGLFVIARVNNDRLRAQLTAKSLQLRAALAKIDGLGRHDPLTGVLNRHTLIETLESELLRARRTGHPFCFAIIDLDHFHVINDTYGSGTGDMVLKALSDAAMRLLRALDRFGRIGGEEFGIVLPATWLDQGMIAMARLAKAVEAVDWKEIASDLTVTFSAGITTNAATDTVETIIKRAEEALAQAKSEGRNRVVQAEEALPDMPVIDPDD